MNAARENAGVLPVNGEEGFLQTILARPSDLDLRLIFADWLEEQGDPRAELMRLLHTLTQHIDPPDRPGLETRLRLRLETGVKPVGPFWTNSIGMEFACIPPGTFQMGSPRNEEMRMPNEAQHPVTLTKGFFLGVHAVTQAQWQKVMGNNPSHFRGDDLPVEQVSWEECQDFCRNLTERDGKPYRLPTEAQWEYSCRAGTTTPFHFGVTISTDQVNYNGDFIYGPGEVGEYRQKTTPVGSFPPNAWGLYDMHGNVFQWCADWHGVYQPGDVTDPTGPPNGECRVLHGGSWGGFPGFSRSAGRYRNEPGRYRFVGFRVCFCLE
jgi:uncharacterized protein (TIGR02996 family)